MNNLRKCKRCQQSKEFTDFYSFAGTYRGECKKCTIKQNVIYNKKVRAYRGCYDESRKIYMREYYRKNKEKFALYRANFKKKHPNYYKEYLNKDKY